MKKIFTWDEKLKLNEKDRLLYSEQYEVKFTFVDDAGFSHTETRMYCAASKNAHKAVGVFALKELQREGYKKIKIWSVTYQ